MNSKVSRKIFIILFALLYVSVAFVSTYHAISFFGLANYEWIAIMLAITFEIGQAAVLFSILTNAAGKYKSIPWILMIVLTLVQILGNVYSSYKYLITNSSEFLKYFKEPIFVWVDLPNAQCNVILTYIVGAILPIVSLLMTSMVTNYINKPDDSEKYVEENPVEKKSVEEKPIQPIESTPQDTIIHEEPINEETQETNEDPPVEEKPKEKVRKSHFINTFENPTK